MLFHVTWTFHNTTEESIKRRTAVFAAWEPPGGVEFKGFYGNADGSGGVAIIEAEDAAALARTTSPWAPWLDFTATPIISVEEGAAIGQEGAAFRDSVS